MSSIKRLAKRIEKENDLFFAMSKDEKKVQIAKDCIVRIKLNQFKVEKGQILTYQPKLSTYQLRQNRTSIKTIINSEEFPECQVCAKGGLFMSYVGRTNDFNVCHLTCSNDSDSSEHKKLLEIFTLRELSLIEYAFEGQKYIHNDEESEPILFDRKQRIKIQKFYARHGGGYRGETTNNSFEPIYTENDNEKDKRLMAICRNIIRNNGTFTI